MSTTSALSEDHSTVTSLSSIINAFGKFMPCVTLPVSTNSAPARVIASSTISCDSLLSSSPPQAINPNDPKTRSISTNNFFIN